MKQEFLNYITSTIGNLQDQYEKANTEELKLYYGLIIESLREAFHNLWMIQEDSPVSIGDFLKTAFLQMVALQSQDLTDYMINAVKQSDHLGDIKGTINDFAVSQKVIDYWAKFLKSKYSNQEFPLPHMMRV